MYIQDLLYQMACVLSQYNTPYDWPIFRIIYIYKAHVGKIVFSVFMWRSHIPKLKTTFPSEILVASDKRSSRNLTFGNVLALLGSSFWNRAFGWHTSPNSDRMKKAETWFLAQLFILQSSIISQILEFFLLNDYNFYIDHMTGENWVTKSKEIENKMKCLIHNFLKYWIIKRI